jgi:para-nitrobenzyl esterase
MQQRMLAAATSLALVLCSAIACADDTQVAMSGGTVLGISADGAIAFKGIPYAAPPIGDLRWRAPQPVEPWQGVRDATAPGHDCMQIPFDDPVAPVGTTPSEDCLVLNIWRPAGPADGLPVMIWIPGGWYVNGGSSTALSDGSGLARQGMVVVTINYRLGRLGFFAHPALIAAKEGSIGNFGYLDQIAALQWVQHNISAFGGDPGKVTLAGESAGGGSVLHMLTSPAAAGLFHRAIVMSGGGRRALAERRMTGGTTDAPSADMVDASFAETLGIAGEGEDDLASLRALPAEELLRDVAFPAFTKALLTQGTTEFPGTPMIDGTIVTDKLERLFMGGKAAAVPLMIGTTVRDAPGFFPPRTDPFSYFGPDAEKATHVFNPGGALPPETVLLGIAADMTMHEPARFVARSMGKTGNPAWLYRFTYAAEAREDRAIGAAHAEELPFMFQTVELVQKERTADGDRQMEQWFSGYIANFVKTGDPNGGDLPVWPTFDPANFELMNFTLDDGPVFGPDPRAERIELVERAADAAVTALPKEVTDVAWEWVSFTTPVEEITIDAPERYTVQFMKEERVAMKADCNRGNGPYTLGADRQIAFGPFALTRMMCPPGSLSDRFVKELGRATSYFLQDGDLFLELPVDSGTLRLRRQK